MKRLIISLVSVFFISAAYCQTLPDFSSIKLESKQDYDSNANNAAWRASNYLLTKPIEKDNITRLLCTQYLLKWMTGTPDYNFSLEEKAIKFAKKDNDLLGLYMAAMCKYSLENKAAASDTKQVEINALKTVIQYAKDPNNNVKMNKELMKLIDAGDKDQLSEYLNS